MMASRVLFSSLIVASGLLLGRMMGFVREASIASTFGVSVEADVAVLALTIPDVLVGMLVAGGLSAAFIPEFKKLSAVDASALFIQASTVAAFAAVLVVCALSFYPEILIFIFAPGMSGESSAIAQSILEGILWLIPLTVLAGVSTAYLQAQEKFFMPAMGTLIFNASVVFGLLVFVEDVTDLYLLVYFVVLGGVLRWCSQLWALREKITVQQAPSKILLHKGLLSRYWEAVLASSLLMLYPVVARSFSSFSGEGGLAMMNYAWRLVEFPLGLVVTILSVVLFPKLTGMYVEKHTKGFENIFKYGLLLSMVLAMAIVGPVLASPETFVYMAFSWGGQISSEKLVIIAELLQLGILILPVQAVIAMSVVAFNARGETYIPAWISAVGFVLLLVLSWLLEPMYGLYGVLLAVLCAYFQVACLLLFVLRQKNMRCFDSSIVIYTSAAIVVSYTLSLLCLSFELDDLTTLVFLILSMALTIVVFLAVSKMSRLDYHGLAK